MIHSSLLSHLSSIGQLEDYLIEMKVSGVDGLLKEIMERIHTTCVKYGENEDFINYVDGANIGGFVRVADSMIDQGIV